MNFLGFGKNRKELNKKESANNQLEKNTERIFTYSVCDSFHLKESNDLVVVGRVNGVIHVGDAVYISNPGEDNASVELSTIVGLEQGDGKGHFVQLQEADNTRVSVRLENCADFNIKPGTVLHSRAASDRDVHSEYINGIGDGYVQGKQVNLTEEDYEKMSITDLTETWRLLNFVMSKQGDIPESVYQEKRQKVGKIAEAMIKKLFELDSIYVIYNKKTNEPHLYSGTIHREDGYECTPPDIMIVTEAYQSFYAKSFEGKNVELRKIENGEDKKGIYNFLGYCFFVNGARGVDFLYEEIAISYEQFMPAPDYSGMREVDIPVNNPDVERWLLLLGQMGVPETDDEKLICNLYYRFLGQEIVKARFIVPMRFMGEKPVSEEGDEEGKLTLKKDTSFQIAVQPGKNGKDAVRFYTDWQKLHMEYGKEWSGMIQTIEQMIDIYDIAINVTKFPQAGCYINKELYEGMKKF